MLETSQQKMDRLEHADQRIKEITSHTPVSLTEEIELAEMLQIKSDIRAWLVQH